MTKTKINILMYLVIVGSMFYIVVSVLDKYIV